MTGDFRSVSPSDRPRLHSRVACPYSRRSFPERRPRISRRRPKIFHVGTSGGLRASKLSRRSRILGTGVRGAGWGHSRSDTVSPAIERCIPGQPSHAESGARHLAANAHHAHCRRPDWPFEWAEFLGQSGCGAFFLGTCGLRIALGEGRRRRGPPKAKSQADLALTQLQVAAAVGNYFLLAVANQQAVMAAQANLDRWQEFNKSIHVLVDNQLRAGADASRADAELARAKIQLYQSQQAERVTLDTLAALMGTAGSEIKLDSGTVA